MTIFSVHLKATTLPPSAMLDVPPMSSVLTRWFNNFPLVLNRKSFNLGVVRKMIYNPKYNTLSKRLKYLSAFVLTNTENCLSSVFLWYTRFTFTNYEKNERHLAFLAKQWYRKSDKNMGSTDSVQWDNLQLRLGKSYWKKYSLKYWEWSAVKRGHGSVGHRDGRGLAKRHRFEPRPLSDTVYLHSINSLCNSLQ